MNEILETAKQYSMNNTNSNLNVLNKDNIGNNFEQLVENYIQCIISTNIKAKDFNNLMNNQISHDSNSLNTIVEKFNKNFHFPDPEQLPDPEILQKQIDDMKGITQESLTQEFYNSINNQTQLLSQVNEADKLLQFMLEWQKKEYDSFRNHQFKINHILQGVTSKSRCHQFMNEIQQFCADMLE
ncbi:hypothetical protein TRFO_04854 [Tritrichomonas foetus]|uniref:Uncharacterized protein n=1 Tax=Tritrichomonas foetus TaxID=1144522 RepID=A0A1J4KGF5_9EUKA|nr:hypothetical protein TRFO_04854 [Tritrichomonas foetus]|eukprot:OHT08742.1 hypothetical protein TRFO_04854 [Tritrichomonas foetus]